MVWLAKFLRLVLTRIRSRTSDFVQVATNFRFCSGRNELQILFRSQQMNIIRAKSKQAFCAEMVLGSFVFRSCDSAVRFLDSENSSQRRLLLCPAPRRVHFARPWTQAYNPTLTDSSLAAKRRAEARDVVFFSTRHPSPAR